MNLIASSDDRDEIAILERHCLRQGIPYRIDATPGPALFGAIAWEFELWAAPPLTDTPKAA